MVMEEKKKEVAFIGAFGRRVHHKVPFFCLVLFCIMAGCLYTQRSPLE